MSKRPQSISKRSRAAYLLMWLGSLWVVLGCSSQARRQVSYGSGASGSGADSTTANAASSAGMTAAGPGVSSGGSTAPEPTSASVSGGSGSGGASPHIDGGKSDGAAAGPDAATVDAMTGAQNGAPRSSHSTGRGDWMAGDYPPDLTSDSWREISGVPGQGDNVRQYKVHVPPSYTPDVPAPVVFCIHGLGQDALLFCVAGTELNKKSDEAGFVLVMPNGYQNSWNAGTCCGGASDEQLDDIALFRAIFAEVAMHVNIDLARVYATGFSNGGYMSYRLACEASDIFTAVAPAAAAIGTNDIGGGTNGASNFVACKPSQPVSILDIHGTEDPLIPYSLQAPTLSLAAMNNGCANTAKPASQPSSAGDTSCVTYDGCPGGIELTACSIDKGGHCWFGSPDCGTGAGDIGLAFVGANSDTMKNTEAVWDFLKRHSR